MYVSPKSQNHWSIVPEPLVDDDIKLIGVPSHSVLIGGIPAVGFVYVYAKSAIESEHQR